MALGARHALPSTVVATECDSHFKKLDQEEQGALRGTGENEVRRNENSNAHTKSGLHHRAVPWRAVRARGLEEKRKQEEARGSQRIEEARGSQRKPEDRARGSQRKPEERLPLSQP